MVSKLPDFIRRRIEAAINWQPPPGSMTLGDGKVRVFGSDLNYMLRLIDAHEAAAGVPPQRPADVCHHDRPAWNYYGQSTSGIEPPDTYGSDVDLREALHLIASTTNDAGAREEAQRALASPRGVKVALQPRVTRPADPTESETKIARREGYDEGWNDCLHAAGVAVAPDNRISVDRGALQMALNVLCRAGKNEVADALAESADAGVMGTDSETKGEKK